MERPYKKVTQCISLVRSLRPKRSLYVAMLLSLVVLVLWFFMTERGAVTDAPAPSVATVAPYRDPLAGKVFLSFPYASSSMGVDTLDVVLPEGGGGDFARPTASSSSATTTSAGSNYSIAFGRMIESVLGAFVSQALYDPSIYRAFLKDPSFIPRGAVEAGLTEEGPSKTPLTFVTLARTLWTIKHSTSVALGTLQFDKDLSTLFDASQNNERQAMTRDLRLEDLINGIGQSAILLINSAVETMSNEERHVWVERDTRRRDTQHNPLLEVLCHIHYGATFRSVSGLLQHWPLPSSVPPLDTLPVSSFEIVNSVHLATQHFEMQEHLPQKVLYTMRSLVRCRRINRECEIADGCRYYCNKNYLMFTSSTVAPAAQEEEGGDGDGVARRRPFYHRFVGIGSNNDYSWELATVRSFSTTTTVASSPPSQPSAAAAVEKNGRLVRNGLFSISTFDCTVNWQPPAELQRPGSGWSRSSLCVGDANRSVNTYLSFVGLIPLIKSSEAHDDGKEHTFGGGGGITVRYSISDMAKISPPPRFHPLFDDISVLKVDIEGHEFGFVDEWYKEYCQGIRMAAAAAAAARTRQDSNTAEQQLLISHADASPFSLSMLLIEIHTKGFGVWGLWHTTNLMLLLQRMGFYIVHHEVNVGGRCVELVLVHYRYFLRSELWMDILSQV